MNKMDEKELRGAQAEISLRTDEIYKSISLMIQDDVDDEVIYRESKKFNKCLEKYWHDFLERKMKT